MKLDEVPYGGGDLFPWVVSGFLILILTYSIYGISLKYMGDSLIAGMTAFAAAVSSIVYVLLVAIYVRQNRIFERHGNIMEAQMNLMEIQYIPNLDVIGEPTIEGNDVEVLIENKGAGSAVNLNLVTRIEFQGSSNYESPLIGYSELSRKDGEVPGEHSLEPGGSGTFIGEARLDISSLSEEERTRAFHNIIRNLHPEVDRVRISLAVNSRGHGGHGDEQSILPEVAFYTRLDDLRENTLEECRRVSVPA